MKHKFLSNNGKPVIVGETNEWPYCMYIMCIYCQGWFCHNGCDSLDKECSAYVEPLFEWEHLVVPPTITDYLV